MLSMIQAPSLDEYLADLRSALEVVRAEGYEGLAPWSRRRIEAGRRGPWPH